METVEYRVAKQSMEQAQLPLQMQSSGSYAMASPLWSRSSAAKYSGALISCAPPNQSSSRAVAMCSS